MKPITQERLIRAIDKIDAALASNAEMTRQTEIIKALSLRGLQSSFALAFNRNRTGVQAFYWKIAQAKKHAEAFLIKWSVKICHHLGLFVGRVTVPKETLLATKPNDWDVPKSERDFHSFIADWQTRIHHYHAKREKVWRIQEKYQVSGLTWRPSDFDPSFSVPWVDESLNLIDSDLDTLNDFKPLHLQKWIDCVTLQDCSFYRWSTQNKQNEWKPLLVTELLSISPYYQWGHTWNHSETFYLLLGNGKDTDSTESDTAWFCATKPNVKPCY